LQIPSRVVARDRRLTDEELVKVWEAARQIGYPFGVIVQLLILTGQRRGEISNLRRDWINGDMVTLPKKVVKNNRTHTFPVGRHALHLIATTPRVGDFLFPARGNNVAPFSGWSKSKPRLDRLSGVDGYTLHDCRRTFAVGLQRCGINVEVIETILKAHSTAKCNGEIFGVEENLTRSSVAEYISGTRVEFVLDPLDIGIRHNREIGTFWEVLSE
jgi:integrase